MTENRKIGFTCAYTPIPVIEAAGFSALRVLPQTREPDQAGHMLHDNMCPHVKRVLDRGLSGDLPDLHGMVFINSCDSMRRLSDAWKTARPGDKTLMLDLPSSISGLSIDFLSKEYERLARTLCEWQGRDYDPGALAVRIENWNRLAGAVQKIREKMSKDYYPGLAAFLQSVINTAAADSVEKALAMTQALEEKTRAPKKGRVPVLIFGNLIADPEIFNRFEEWNVHVAVENFCTGSRFLTPIETRPAESPFLSMARSFMTDKSCARTIDTEKPGAAARKIVEKAKKAGAKGVIAFILKFCDPFLARIPAIRNALKEESIPFLLLEGDLTLGSIEQHRTRIEAFTEMLEE